MKTCICVAEALQVSRCSYTHPYAPAVSDRIFSNVMLISSGNLRAEIQFEWLKPSLLNLTQPVSAKHLGKSQIKIGRVNKKKLVLQLKRIFYIIFFNDTENSYIQ